jgi:epoxyqueuosine reductase
VKQIEKNEIEKNSPMLKHISMRNDEIKSAIEKYAKDLGFDLVGFSGAKLPGKYFNSYRKWLKDGMNAEMGWMEKAAARKNIEEILPGAKTVICLGLNYYHEQPPLRTGEGRVARYAYGRDYHKVIGKKLKELEKFISRCEPKASTKSYVDTGAILERAYAENAGLGFIGKNSCLITKEFGSWVFLAEVVTDLEIAPDKNETSASKKSQTQSLRAQTQFTTSGHESQNGFLEPKHDRKSVPVQTMARISTHSSVSSKGLSCGTCTKCIHSCPTGAIIAPGVIDASKCISYLTIENKKPIPKRLAKIIKKHQLLFGCDICQEVCPHNCRAKKHTHKELAQPRFAGDSLKIKDLLRIKTDEQFLAHFAGSPLMRAKRAGLERNAKLIIH